MSFYKTLIICLCLAWGNLVGSEVYSQLPAPILPAPAEIQAESKKISAQPLAITEHGRLSLVLKESFFKSIPTPPRVEEGPVRDFILGADVVGVQRTVSELAVDFLPCTNAALFNFQLIGTTNNETTSITRQAAIRNRGRYDFILNKKVQFDGQVVTTWVPSALLRVQQQNLGAATPLAPLPILGRIAEQTAMNVANQRLPEVEQIAAYKVAQQVAPEFNESLDAEISKVNREQLPSLREWLKKLELSDLVIKTRTTDLELFVDASTRLGESAKTPARLGDPRSSGAISVDEGFLNNLIQRLPLAGLRIPDTQIENFLETRQFEFGQSENPKLFSIVLDEQRPLWLFLRNGQLEVEARLSIQPILGEKLGSMLFVFGVKAIPDGNALQLIPSVLDVQPLDEAAAGNVLFSPDTIQQSISNQLEGVPLPRTLPLSFLDEYPNAQLKVLSLQETGGDLNLEFQVELNQTQYVYPIQYP